MDGAIFVWWMVVAMGGNSAAGAAVMPVPYQTLVACESAATEADIRATCIPQSAADLAEFASLTAIDPTHWGVPE